MSESDFNEAHMRIVSEDGGEVEGWIDDVGVSVVVVVTWRNLIRYQWV